MIEIVWRDLFHLQPILETRRGEPVPQVPVILAWASLFALCAFSLWLLNRRLVAREVVR
jgi:hypothetical protein